MIFRFSLLVTMVLVIEVNSFIDISVPWLFHYRNNLLCFREDAIIQI